VTNAIPNAATEAQFSSLFEPRPANNKKKYEEVFFTLNNVVDTFDNFAGEQDEDASHWQAALDANHNAESRQLDGLPRSVPLDKIISRLPPYKAPPPPLPFGEAAAMAPTTTKKRASKAKASTASRGKRTTILVTLTEFTNPDGEKHYLASGKPVIRIPNDGEVSTDVHNMWEQQESGLVRQPFLDRMRIRQERWQEYREERGANMKLRLGAMGESAGAKVWQEKDMLLISVKRQRKLKMKKHKYKKLMRKTRNLRRKLGRL
jgi:hypothetical protein